jgi:hypothetical protein
VELHAEFLGRPLMKPFARPHLTGHVTRPWTTYLLIEQIAEFLPSEMTRHSDFEQSPIHFVHFRILGECGLSEEYVLNLMLDADVQLKSV